MQYNNYYSKRRGAYIAARKAQRAQEFMQCLTPKKNCSYETKVLDRSSL